MLKGKEIAHSSTDLNTIVTILVIFFQTFTFLHVVLNLS